MAAETQQEEQVRVDDVVGQIQTKEHQLQAKMKQAETEEADIHKHFEKDVKINTGSYEGMMDTALSIRQQQQMLDERTNSWQHSAQQLDVLQRLEKTPYFARIDFQENRAKKPETIYIGLGSFTDNDDHFLVYDWRAPISSIYYDGNLGKVSYQTPDGEQQVNVDLKRQFLIEDGQIKTMFDTQETIGDQMLMEVLGEQSDTKMKSIVTTIQREQNQIIRDTKAELLFVQGAAGSGKTSAIMQRVAYLLYRYRGNLNSSQVIMFSPNQLFNDYIGNVLPELGEQNMVQLTYHQYAARRLPNMTVEDLFSQFEKTNGHQDKRLTQLKASLAFFKATQDYATHLEQADMRFRDIKLRKEVFISKEKIAQTYYQFNHNYHLGNRLTGTKEKMVRYLNRRIESETKTKWVSDFIESLDDEGMRKWYGNHPHNFENGDEEFHFLAKRVVTAAFDSVRRGIVRNRFLNIKAQYIDFLRAVPQYLDLAQFDLTVSEWQHDVDRVLADLRQKKLAMEDVTPYLYLYDLITGKHGDREIRYLFIDEIQDYTPYQLAFLKFNFPQARFTLLGDLNQAIFTQESSHRLLQELSYLFDPETTRVVQLTQSYRSTKQITDFTKAILRNGEDVQAFNRKGQLPKLIQREDPADLVAAVKTELAANTDAGLTTAIITKTLPESQALTQQLKAAGVKVTLIRSENQRLAAGTIVVPSYLAKGLEFDAIIAWQVDAANYGSDDERQLLYTIASRAMHRLTLLSSGTLSPLLADVPAALYEKG
ncbi:RNA polymerase recycling motor HelD [Loigolactobacillus bifermentans]|jgi:DNA helicase-2/ATP-dependent DNA helicase PcrA|uniref:DNA helicase superfamily protein I n=1 Tax=Loigolactobacillus bifermentans DSM 20003 TaxID=1423726 RepID=A0A0R1GKQ3_9LACO|nr:RNA polymerase recycling motor HelD [Loigolactobacillus bifermentans]KRK34603.1 DNA helicase superfamily protein I [Loigolactobacillus bifermentans DSM 20003]QGG61127.1 AAA family ATPase [Loigolactobacillus bifermentans]